MTDVNTPAALAAALTLAKPGDVIGLAPGTYAGLDLALKYVKVIYDAPGITLTSADPANRAVLNDFYRQHWRGVTCVDLDFYATSTSGFAFQIHELKATTTTPAVPAERIAFDRCRFVGVPDNTDLRSGGLLSIGGARNVSVTRSEFRQHTRGAAFGAIDGLTVIGNYVHDLRSDGFDFADTDNVRVGRNVFRNFFPVATATGVDHPDAIQFQSASAISPSSNVDIFENLIELGEGLATQGIFLRDQQGTLPYENVRIADNLIVFTGHNGIRLQGVKGLQLLRNRLLTRAGTAEDVKDAYTNILIQGSGMFPNPGPIEARDNEAYYIGFEKPAGLVQSGNITGKTYAPADVARVVAEWVAQRMAAA